MGEHWNHILIGLTVISISTKTSRSLLYLVVKMVYLVTLVENVPHHLWRWCINDSGRNNVDHITMVLVFWHFQLRVGIKLANSSQMYITAAMVVSGTRVTSMSQCLP